MLRLLPLILLVVSCATSTYDSPLAGSRQLIVVRAPDWNATTATLRRYERSRSKWLEVGTPVDVVLGRTGMAWGRGLHRRTDAEPQKKEGDGKSPAGAFNLGSAFGFSAEAPTTMPYLQLLETTECVDDDASPLYNQIVDRNRVTKVDWKSSEKMRAIDDYRWGIVVRHNLPAVKGGGSCIFLHLRGDSKKPTAGCTAMAATDLEELLGWLDPGSRPMIVQLPEEQYGKVREAWGLP